jgi:hypothetical protein
MHLQRKTQTIEECIQSCESCHEICVDTTSYCLKVGGEHTEPDHMRLLVDCHAICHLSLDSMLRESATSIELCRACAEICDRCAAECERFTGDEQMQACARECRKCAQACRQMVGAVARGGAAAGPAATRHR